jgi:hypothetical protein
MRIAYGMIGLFALACTTESTPLLVVSVQPAGEATDVAVETTLVATLSAPMDPTSVASRFSLKAGDTPIDGNVAVSGAVATFTPSAPLQAGTSYTATLADGAKALDGRTLRTAVAWSFSTAAQPLRVVSVSPPDGATGVGVISIVSVTFGSLMDSATLDTNTFTLLAAGQAVDGTIRTSGATATFSPASPLSSRTQYTATITTGAQDLAGNALSENYSWSFTTSDVVDQTPPTLVSVSPQANASAVPIDTTVTATFSKTIAAGSLDASSFSLRAGTARAVDARISVRGPTVTLTPVSSLAPSTTYTATLTVGIQDLAGNHLARNFVWTFTTGDTVPPTVASTTPPRGATTVAPDTVIQVVFSEAVDPESVGSQTFFVTADSGPVAGAAGANGSNASFVPMAPLSRGTTYTATLTTGVRDLAGNPLASNYVWSFTISQLPTVVSTQPADGATGIEIDATVQATFSLPVDSSSVNASTFMLRQGSGTIAGTVSSSGAAVTFRPSAPLAPNLPYRATLTTGVRDVNGNHLAADYAWSFTTAPDTTPPTVTATTPANGATAVPVTATVTATFSEPVDSTTVNSQTFTVTSAGGAPVAGAIQWRGSSVTFTPTSTFSGLTVYAARASTGIRDLAGNPLTADVVWTFTTAPDTVPPRVVSTSPTLNGQVPPRTVVSMTFSEPLDPTTVSDTTFTLSNFNTGTVLPGIVSYSGQTATFTPSSPLAYGTTFSAMISGTVKDLAGNAMGSDYYLRFSTPTYDQATHPTVTANDPPENATGIPVGAVLRVTFSTTMDSTTITPTTFTLTRGTTAVSGTVSAAGNTATFTPSSPLTAKAIYRATIESGILDVNGNDLTNSFQWSFTPGTPVWPLPSRLDPLGSFTSPRIAVDGSGNAMALWIRNSSIHSNRYTAGSGWGAKMQVSSTGNSPDLSVSSDGSAMAVWTYGGNVFASHYTTATWNAPTNMGSGFSPKVAMNAVGNSVLIFNKYDATQNVYGVEAIRYTAGSGWGSLTRIDSENASASEPRVALDGSGNAMAVWVQSNSIYANQSASGSGWGTATPLQTYSTAPSSPDLAMNSAGAAAAVWVQADSIYASRYLPDTGWSTAATIESANQAASSPSVAIDGQGNAVAAWTQSSLSAQSMYASTYAGGGWGAPMLLSDSAGPGQPSVAMDSLGDAIAAWAQATGSLYATRFTAASGWGPASPVEGGAGAAWDYQAAIDETGKAFVLWSQESTAGGSQDIWVNRL